MPSEPELFCTAAHIWTTVQAKAKSKAKAAPSAVPATTVPLQHTTTGKDSISYSHAANASVSGPPVDAVMYASSKHKHKKHIVDYSQEYDDDVSEEEAYWEDHWEDERRASSRHPPTPSSSS